MVALQAQGRQVHRRSADTPAASSSSPPLPPPVQICQAQIIFAHSLPAESMPSLWRSKRTPLCNCHHTAGVENPFEADLKCHHGNNSPALLGLTTDDLFKTTFLLPVQWSGGPQKAEKQPVNEELQPGCLAKNQPVTVDDC